ncbi:hypothetical protein PRIPAC_74374 [Pristionchus pacificus]|uniref:Uncharacterized protein n=1 Tax=Pristionchus pacificus TaxID=54126 RepID=A0A2A6C0U5_PRIPA|nr:hypothetical protein PRIPAC_74374 [Pristionchus pacificus]|eukprot:PDM71739.1 hypothetical protein PRIPAC_38146 [Pristionchus pacificus]
MPSVVENITCQPALTPTYAACVLNGKKPSIQFALILKDTFGCMPGYKFNYVSTTLKKIYTVPVQLLASPALHCSTDYVDGVDDELPLGGN